MAIYKTESNNTWYVMVRYQDWTGERKQKCKRGLQQKEKLHSGSSSSYSRRKPVWIWNWRASANYMRKM